MRQGRNLKDAKGSVRFTRRGKSLFLIVTAIVLLALSAGGAYGLPYLAGKWAEQSAADKRSKENGAEKENSKIQKISNIEHSSKQNETSESGRWIYYGRNQGDRLTEADIEYLDSSVKKWTQGTLTDEELAEWIGQRIRTLELPLESIGVMSGQRCLFECEDAIPDYEIQLRESGGIYTFIGLYTEDEVDEEGNLICYYWEAGVR